MQRLQRQTASPVMVLKTIGLSLSMALGFGAAFYAGYNRMPYVLAPCIFLELSCSTNLVLLNRYLKGTLMRESNSNSMMGSFWFGCVLLVLSVAGSIFFAAAHWVDIDGFEYRDYGLYAALVPCVLAVFWSSVLIYDARFYWRMWQRESSNMMAGRQIGMQNAGYANHPGYFK